MVEDNKESLERRIEILRREGLPVAPTDLSLQLQILSELSSIHQRMTLADQARDTLVVAVNDIKMEQGRVQIELTKHLAVVEKVEELRKAENLNTSFRQQFIGGGLAVKLIWLFGGGFILFLIQRFMGKS